MLLVCGTIGSMFPGMTVAKLAAKAAACIAVWLVAFAAMPAEDRALLDERQRALIGLWRALLARVHPEWDKERVRTAVHGAFGMLNASDFAYKSFVVAGK